MADANQNITLFAGTTLTVEITITDTDTGLPLNLTGFTIEWGASRLSSTPSSTNTPLIEKCTSDGTIIITDAANGIFEFTLNPADTVNLYGLYTHQVRITDVGGAVTITTTGTLTVTSSLDIVC